MIQNKKNEKLKKNFVKLKFSTTLPLLKKKKKKCLEMPTVNLKVCKNLRKSC